MSTTKDEILGEYGYRKSAYYPEYEEAQGAGNTGANFADDKAAHYQTAEPKKNATTRQREAAAQQEKPAADTTGGVVTTPAAKPQGTVKTRSSYEDFAKMTEAPESEEQKVKRLKGQRSAKILAGVGDLVSSLANLYFAHHGAKSSFDPKQGLSAKAQERFDKIDKEHQDYKKWYTAEALRAMKTDKDAADKLAVQQALEQHRAEIRRIREESEANRRQRDDANAQLNREKFEHKKQVDEDKRNGVGTYGKKGGSGRVGGYTTTKYDKNGNPVSTTVREPAARSPRTQKSNNYDRFKTNQDHQSANAKDRWKNRRTK